MKARSDMEAITNTEPKGQTMSTELNNAEVENAEVDNDFSHYFNACGRLRDEKTALKARVNELEAALSEQVCKGCDNRIGYNEWPTKYGNWKTCGTCAKARAALGRKEGSE